MKISELSPGIHLHTSFKFTDDYGMVGSNGLVVIIANNAYLIDTPWSVADTETLVNWIDEQGYELKASISTHSHEDRSAGITFLNAISVPTHASTLTNEFLAKEKKELASHPFDETEFWLVPDQIEIFYPGGGHTLDNVVVWLPQSKLLAGGCFVRSLSSKNLGYTGEASIDTWADAVTKVQTRYPDAEVIVPGHGSIGDKTLLSHTKKLAMAAATKLALPDT